MRGGKGGGACLYGLCGVASLCFLLLLRPYLLWLRQTREERASAVWKDKDDQTPEGEKRGGHVRFFVCCAKSRARVHTRTCGCWRAERKSKKEGRRRRRRGGVLLPAREVNNTHAQAPRNTENTRHYHTSTKISSERENNDQLRAKGAIAKMRTQR